jgi:hypothetical protein
MDREVLLLLCDGDTVNQKVAGLSRCLLRRRGFLLLRFCTRSRRATYSFTQVSAHDCVRGSVEAEGRDVVVLALLR